MRRRSGEIRSGEARTFSLRELPRRMALAGEQRGNSISVEAARLPERAEHFGSGACIAHDPGGRAFPAQRVIDEARNRRAVAGAGEAMRQAPVLHRVGRRAATRLDVREHFDRGGDARGGGHAIKSLWRRKQASLRGHVLRRGYQENSPPSIRAALFHSSSTPQASHDVGEERAARGKLSDRREPDAPTAMSFVLP